LSGFLQTENNTFRKLDLFPSSGEGGGAPTLQKNQKLAFPQAMFWHRLWKSKLAVITRNKFDVYL
jgi:hypothetical protein